MAEQTPKTSTSVFISYSRKDKEFVKRLNDGLDGSGVAAWVDWEGIPLSADWMAEITHAIEGADAFLFVISPDSLSSKICADELELGLKANKKLIPILYREPKKGTEMHKALAATNWVYLREQDDFNATLPKLLEALATDLAWVRQHTRLYQRAVEWRDKNYNASFLLQGSDLTEAEAWLSQGAAQEGRSVNQLQVEYIQTSRKVAMRRQRNLLIGVSFAFLLSVALGIFAFISRNEAVEQRQIANDNAQTAVANEHARATQQYIAEQNQALAQANENLAKAQSSAAQAQIYQGQTGEINLSTLLAIDSWQRAPSFQSQDILRTNISLMPLPGFQLNQSGEISSIRFSPDGTQFVTTSLDSTACVWELENPDNHFCLQHDDDVLEGLFTPDGAQLVTSSADGIVRVWNLADQSLFTYFDLNASILDIDINVDGSLLAVGCSDNTVHIFDLRMVHGPFVISQPGMANVVTFSPRGTWLAIGTSAGTVTLWKVDTNISVAGPQHRGEVYAMAFSPDGSWLVSVGSDNKARVSAVSLAGQYYAVSQDDWLEDVAFSPYGSWFVTVGDDNTIKVWDTSSGAELLTMLQENFVQKVRVSPNGQWIATTGKDRTVRVWDAATGGEMYQISLEARGTSLAFNQTGTRLVSGDADGHIGIWNIEALSARTNHIEFPEFIHLARFAPDGNLVVNSDDKKVWLLDAEQYPQVQDGTLGTPVLSVQNLTYSMDISLDENWLVVAEQLGKQATLYNFETGETFRLRHDAKVNAVAFSPDSLRVATADEQGLVVVWNMDSGERVFEFRADSPVYSVSFDSSGRYLAAGSRAVILVFDLLQRDNVLRLPQTGDIKVVEFSLDGNWLATASTDGMVNLWAVQNGSISSSALVLQHGSEILSMSFNIEGTMLAVGCQNGFAYVWDVATVDEVFRIPHTAGVTGVSFSYDGKLLSTASRKTVQIWDLSQMERVTTDGLVDSACAHLFYNMSEEQWQTFFFEEPYRLLCESLPVSGQ